MKGKHKLPVSLAVIAVVFAGLMLFALLSSH